MIESIKPKSLPPLRMSELQEELKKSASKHKQDVLLSYREVKKKKEKELAELNKYKTLAKKGFILIEKIVFNSQSKLNGQQFEL